MTGLARDRTSDCRVSHFVFFFGSSPVIQRPDTVTLPLPSLQHWQYPSPLKGLKPVTCKLWFILNSHTQLCTLSCNGNLEWDCSWYSPLLKNSNIALYSENLFHLVILNSSFFFLFFFKQVPRFSGRCHAWLLLPEEVRLFPSLSHIALSKRIYQHLSCKNLFFSGVATLPASDF